MEFQRFLNRLTLITFLLIVGTAWLLWSPRSLTKFDGYGTEPMSKQEAEIYLDKIIDNLRAGNIVRLKENGVNRFLNERVSAKHSRAVKPWVTVNGVYLNFTPEHYGLCLEQEIYGRAHHSELKRSIVVSSPTKFSIDYKGGMIGKLKLPSQVVYHLSPWIEQLEVTLKPVMRELKPHVRMIELGDGELILHPSKPS